MAFTTQEQLIQALVQHFFGSRGIAGSTLIHTGQTATGSFCAIISMGRSEADGVKGSNVAACVGNVKDNSRADLANVFIPCGFSLTGGFTSVTAGADAKDILICVHTPSQGN
jgi:hypothetical protein